MSKSYRKHKLDYTIQMKRHKTIEIIQKYISSSFLYEIKPALICQAQLGFSLADGLKVSREELLKQLLNLPRGFFIKVCPNW